MEPVNLSLIEATYSRTQEPIYRSPWCTIPKARLIDYARAIAFIPSMMAEIKELRAAVKDNS
jgi:hypothetical protein